MSRYEDYLEGNIETSDSSRSAKDFAFACFLAKKGLTLGESCAILKSTEDTYNRGKDLSDKYLQRTILKAMETVKECGVQIPTATVESTAGVIPQEKAYGMLSTPNNPSLLSFSELQHLEIPEIETIPTPLDFLNDYLAGGFGLGEVTLLVAEQESGKTTLSCYLAAHAKRIGYNVLCVHYEDSLLALKKRYSMLLKDDITSDSELYLVNALNYPNTSIEHIRNYIRKTKATFVVLDYFSRIPSNDKKPDSRLEVRDVIQDLASLASQEQCAILVTDHVVIKTDYKNPTYRMTFDRISENKKDKLATANYVIGLCKHKDNPEKLYATGMKAKREFRKMFQLFYTNWKTCEFWV